MNDTSIQTPIRVWIPEGTGPFLSVPLDQLDKVLELLQANGIRHWAEDWAISVDDRPATVVVHLDKNCDPRQVQQILVAATLNGQPTPELRPVSRSSPGITHQGNSRDTARNEEGTDTSDRKPIRVRTAGTAGAYIDLPVARLDRVRTLLQEHGIGHWVDDWSMSVDGRPPTTLIYLEKKCDPDQVQRILDADA